MSCQSCTLPPNTFLPVYTMPILQDPWNNPVRDNIYHKIFGPYSSRIVHEELNSVFTDMDHFPYTRFFRGNYESTSPTVFEREAGVVVHDNMGYVNEYGKSNVSFKPNWCFETACSTRTPCKPDYLIKSSDKRQMDTMLDRLTTTISP